MPVHFTSGQCPRPSQHPPAGSRFCPTSQPTLNFIEPWPWRGRINPSYRGRWQLSMRKSRLFARPPRRRPAPPSKKPHGPRIPRGHPHAYTGGPGPHRTVARRGTPPEHTPSTDPPCGHCTRGLVGEGPCRMPLPPLLPEGPPSQRAGHAAGPSAVLVTISQLYSLHLANIPGPNALSQVCLDLSSLLEGEVGLDSDSQTVGKCQQDGVWHRGDGWHVELQGDAGCVLQSIAEGSEDGCLRDIEHAWGEQGTLVEYQQWDEPILERGDLQLLQQGCLAVERTPRFVASFVNSRSKVAKILSASARL